MKNIEFQVEEAGSKMQVTARYRGLKLAMEGTDVKKMKEDLAKDLTDRITNNGASE